MYPSCVAEISRRRNIDFHVYRCAYFNLLYLFEWSVSDPCMSSKQTYDKNETGLPIMAATEGLSTKIITRRANSRRQSFDRLAYYIIVADTFSRSSSILIVSFLDCRRKVALSDFEVTRIFPPSWLGWGISMLYSFPFLLRCSCSISSGSPSSTSVS